jgi:hypothetical protein
VVAVADCVVVAVPLCVVVAVGLEHADDPSPLDVPAVQSSHKVAVPPGENVFKPHRTHAPLPVSSRCPGSQVKHAPVVAEHDAHSGRQSEHGAVKPSKLNVPAGQATLSAFPPAQVYPAGHITPAGEVEPAGQYLPWVAWHGEHTGKTEATPPGLKLPAGHSSQASVTVFHE